MEIIEGVYQLVTPFPQFTYAQAREIRQDLGKKPRWIRSLPYVLPYLIRSQGNLALVDNGWNTDVAHEALAQGMAEHAASPEELNQLIITHVHPDHFGLTGRLWDESGAEVVMHEKEAEVINSRYLRPQPLVDQMQNWMGRHGVPEMTAPELARGSMSMLTKFRCLSPTVSCRAANISKLGISTWRLSGRQDTPRAISVCTNPTGSSC